LKWSPHHRRTVECSDIQTTLNFCLWILSGLRTAARPCNDDSNSKGMTMSKDLKSSPTTKTDGVVHLHRVFASTPEKLYRAFLDAEAMAKWLPPYGFTCKVHHLDAKVGGTFRMSFTNFTTAKSHSFGGEYIELLANERIRYTDVFDDPNLPGEMRVTVTFKMVSVGTGVNIEQAGIPHVIPVEACYLGWQQSLAQLALVVEPNIPD
jgi:uncharacterized protein YndB with AHSA1/START domain